MYIALSIVIWIVTMAFVTAPFWRGRMQVPALTGSARAAEHDRELLLERRDDLLRELKDLEFDREMGKIEADDYQELRATTASAAAAVLEKIEGASTPSRSRRKRRGEARDNGQATGLDSARTGAEVEAEAEILIVRARRKLSLTNGTNGTATETTPGTWRCDACGRAMSDADRFCGSCGKPHD